MKRMGHGQIEFRGGKRIDGGVAFDDRRIEPDDAPSGIERNASFVSSRCREIVTVRAAVPFDPLDREALRPFDAVGSPFGVDQS